MKLFRLLGRAAVLWFRRDADIHAAALAYFVPFALTPLLLLSITLVGLLIGQDEVVALLLHWGNRVNPEITALLELSVHNFNTITVTYYVPVLGIIFFSTMVLVALNSLGAGIHKMWQFEAYGVMNWFRRSIRSISFVFLLQVYLVCMIVLNRTIVFIAHVPIVHVLELLYPFLLYLSTLVLFTVGYSLLPIRTLSLRARFYGAVVASCLFFFTRELVALHSATTPIPHLFGAAGLVIVMLVWIYVAASIVFYGAAFAAAYEEAAH
jgi:membrane protein